MTCHVLLLYPSSVPGGSERAVASLARHLPAFDFEPRAVLLQDGPLEDWLVEAGCPVSPVPCPGSLRAGCVRYQGLFGPFQMNQRSSQPRPGGLGLDGQ